MWNFSFIFFYTIVIVWKLETDVRISIIRFLLQSSVEEFCMQVSLEYCNSLSLLLLSTPSVQNPAATAADVDALFPAGVLDQSVGPCNESIRPPTTSVDDALPRPHGRWSKTPVLSGKAVAGPLRRLGGSSKGRWMHGTAAEADEDAEQRPGTTRCWDIALSPTNIDE